MKLARRLLRGALAMTTLLLLQAAAAQSELDGDLIDYAAKGLTVELVGREAVEGRDAYKLKLAGKNQPPQKLQQDIANAKIDIRAQETLLAAKKKEVDTINAKYDDDKKRYLELTKGTSK